MAYLDGRTEAWQDERDCAFACHTGFPHLLALSASSGGTTSQVDALRDELVDRSADWSNVQPWYSSYTEASRGTEAVLNAAGLVALDLHRGDGRLLAATRVALDVMWSEQNSDGGWSWLDVFGLLPWEAGGAAYWGALQAALAVATAPGNYLATCAANSACNGRLEALRRYLRSGLTTSANAHARAWALLVSYRLSGVLTASEQAAAVAAIVAKQRGDGAWSQATLGLGRGSDAAGSAYATAIMVAALARSGSPAVLAGRAWLEGRQRADGAWGESSLNQPTDGFNNELFTDAATAYVAYALRSTVSGVALQLAP